MKPENEQTLIEPVKLLVNRVAFESCSLAKKKLLATLKKRACNTEWQDFGGALGNPVSPQTLVWYFTPEEFLAVTKEFPWLLDANLGEKDA